MKGMVRSGLRVALLLQVTLAGMARSPSPTNEQKSLADTEREARARKQPATSTFVFTGTNQADASALQYKRGIQALLDRSAFEELDAAADSARISKGRFQGAGWKLWVFYNRMSNPAGGDGADDAAWTRQLAILQQWVNTRPSSITARIALAEAYRNLAWRARGRGSASTVSDAGWQEFEKEDRKAHQILVDAEALPVKCPHWYLVMLELARDEGVSIEETRPLLDRAIALEPGYFYTYREYALNLLPNWHGKPGDAEAFADDIYRRIGGRQGAFIYFEIASVLYCMCNRDPKPTMSWPILKEGFAELEERYGSDTTIVNRFALLAYLYRDKDIARNALERMGAEWEATVWISLATPNSARFWAGLPAI
jgi:hypothetical protein